MDARVGAAVDMVGLVGAVSGGMVDRLVGSSIVGGLVGNMSRSSVGMVGLVGAMGRGMVDRMVGLYMVFLMVVGQEGGGCARLVGPGVGGEPG